MYIPWETLKTGHPRDFKAINFVNNSTLSKNVKPYIINRIQGTNIGLVNWMSEELIVHGCMVILQYKHKIKDRENLCLIKMQSCTQTAISCVLSGSFSRLYWIFSPYNI